MADLAARVTGNVPVVMVLGPSCNNHNDLGAAQRVIQTNPTLGAILIAEQRDRNSLQTAMRYDIPDVIELGNEAAELSDTVRRVALTLDADARLEVLDPQRFLSARRASNQRLRPDVAPNLENQLRRCRDSPVSMQVTSSPAWKAVAPGMAWARSSPCSPRRAEPARRCWQPLWRFR